MKFPDIFTRRLRSGAIWPGWLFIFIILTACEKELTVDLPPYSPKLVVDGWIEQGRYPTVTLTRNAAYFDKIDSTAIRELIATTAKVTISDGEQEEVLTLRRRDEHFPYFLYQGTEIKGEVGKTYGLKVELRGKVYTASTTVPKPVPLDSLWFERLPDEDSLGYLWAAFTDAPEEENYYRLFTQELRQDSSFVPTYLSVVGDRYFNGETLRFSVLRGAENLNDVTEDLYFKRGDTIRVKFCTLDRAHFDFWRTLERELYTTGNPFAASGNEVISNIEGEALGVWGGYGASYYYFIAP